MWQGATQQGHFLLMEGQCLFSILISWWTYNLMFITVYVRICSKIKIKKLVKELRPGAKRKTGAGKKKA